MDETFKWVVSALVGLTSSIGFFWLNHVTGTLDDHARELSLDSQRLSRLEAQVSGHIETVNRRLDRIEAKLDYLIDKKNNP